MDDFYNDDKEEPSMMGIGIIVLVALVVIAWIL